jgi:hypothetical protein
MRDKSKETSMKIIVYSFVTMAVIVIILNIINLILL